MKYKTFDEHWQEINKNYNWERQHELMKYLSHNWYNIGVPKINDLKLKVSSLMRDVWRPHTCQTASGGFTVKYWHADDNFEVWYTPPGLHWETNPL